jgi:hypothetical protein
VCGQLTVRIVGLFPLAAASERVQLIVIQLSVVDVAPIFSSADLSGAERL